MNLHADENKNRELMEKAELFCRELSEHPVLREYWDRLSVVLKGSTAHGYSDNYSDVDLVLFCQESVRREITEKYVQAGLSQRTDGVFLPLHDWEGHYNTESYESLTKKFQENRVEYLWEYGGSRILHDPKEILAGIVASGMEAFRADLPERIKEKYLDCQLQLDWLRQPLRRGDLGASLLYASSVYRDICQLLFLLAGEPYPCDKWLPYYFSKLELPQTIKAYGEAYPKLFDGEDPASGLPLEEYPLYHQGAEALGEIQTLLVSRFGEQQWIDEWYLYA